MPDFPGAVLVNGHAQETAARQPQERFARKSVQGLEAAFVLHGEERPLLEVVLFQFRLCGQRSEENEQTQHAG